MPTAFVFDGWGLALVLMCAAFAGSVCTYIGGLFEKPPTEHLAEITSRDLGQLERRFNQLLHWKKRFVSHYNHEFNKREAPPQPAYVTQAEFDSREIPDAVTRARLEALESYTDQIRPFIDRHGRAIDGLIAANGEFEALKQVFGLLQSRLDDAIQHFDRVNERLNAVETKAPAKKRKH